MGNRRQCTQQSVSQSKSNPPEAQTLVSVLEHPHSTVGEVFAHSLTKFVQFSLFWKFPVGFITTG
eukprot:621012-Rhodomonas_salina.4